LPNLTDGVLDRGEKGIGVHDVSWGGGSNRLPS